MLTACSGRDALTILAVSSPDVVLTDVTMPGLDGLSFATKLRHRPAAPPVVLMSGVMPTGLRDVPLLRKPFDIAELLRKWSGVAGGVAATPHPQPPSRRDREGK